MKTKLSFLIAASLFSTNVFAANCPQFFAGGSIPTQTHSIKKQAEQLCFEDFSVLHSGVTKTPLWSAEYLTREKIKKGKDVARTDSFHPEYRLAADRRAELNDYKRSGYDRGHMTPDRDAPWSNDLDSLANMVPQEGHLNRGPWADLEKDTRRLAMLRGGIYVITGPAFDKTQKEKFIGKGVRVPTHIWKVIYDPKQNEIQAFLAQNLPSGKVQVVALEEVEKLAGFRLFPAVKGAKIVK